MSVAKEQIRQIIADNNLNSVADVYTCSGTVSKTYFRNLWKRSWMHHLVMKKITRVMSELPTSVMVIHQKHSRASMVNSRLMSQETVRGNSS